MRFGSIKDMVRYMLPGDKAIKCIAHLRNAIGYLQEQILEAPPAEPNTGHAECRHCARDVLAEIRRQTGAGSEVLEGASVVLDGGVGLHGGACGALAAAALITGLVSGTDYREMKMAKGLGVLAAMVRAGGISKPVSPGKDHYDVFRWNQAFGRIKAAFVQQAGSMNCREIAGRRFSNYMDFCEFVSGSDRCNELKTLVVDSTIKELSAAGGEQ